MPVTRHTQGQLGEIADGFAADLATSQQAAVDQMLAAWSQSYWTIRADLDVVLAKIADAKAEGVPFTPAWLYQENRLKTLLGTTKVEMAKYAQFATQTTDKAQASAIAAAVKHAEKLAKTAVAEHLPGYAADFTRIDPANLQHLVGHLADGSPLRDLLTDTIPAKAAQRLERALVNGVALGHSPDRMLRAATDGLALSHGRAVTILRTESQRAYRAATRAQYMANEDVLEGWTWRAHLDARCCLSCAIMDGTVHPISSTLDGHPRCRCAMVPRTKSWADLGIDLEDSRPPIRDGKAWLTGQTPAVQRALMGPAKFKAWTHGDITLDDMVARSYSPKWGTMRSERSLVAIQEGRHANWVDQAHPTPPSPSKAPPVPNMDVVADIVANHDTDEMLAMIRGPYSSPQQVADWTAAYRWKTTDARIGPVKPPAPEPGVVDDLFAGLEDAALAHGTKSDEFTSIWDAVQDGLSQTDDYQWHVNSQALAAKVAAKQVEWEAAYQMKAAKAAKRQALAEAQATAEQALKTVDQTYGTAGPAALEKALKDLKESAYHEAVPAKFGSPAHDAAMAKYDLYAAAAKDYAAAADSAKAKVGTWTKTNSYGQVTLTISDDGWGALINPLAPDAVITLQPKWVLQTLEKDADDWAQVVEPQASEVIQMIVLTTDPDGFVDAQFLALMEKELTQPDKSPQWTANAKDAIAKQYASGSWKPEPQYVAKIKGDLESGVAKVDALKHHAALPDTKPLTKANIHQAIAEYEAEQIAKASIPIPKPIIDPAKFDWTLASAKAVDQWKAKVKSGALSMDDLYAKFQASKNKPHKTNVAKAILDLEGVDTGPTIPTLGPDVDPQMFATWSNDLATGVVNAEELEDLIVWAGSTKTDKATAKAVLKAHKPKGGTVTPPAPPKAPSGPVVPNQPPFQVADLTDTGKRLGTHGAQVWTDKAGNRWLFKPPAHSGDQFLVTLDEGVARLQAKVGLKTPDTWVVTLGGKRGSIQRMFEAEDAFPTGFKADTLTDYDQETMLRHHVLDWLISNHDGHRNQWLRLPDGDLVGIDKGQAFKWFGKDRLDWTYDPGPAMPGGIVYNHLWADFAQGGKTLIADPKHGPLGDAIRAVQNVDDDDLRALFRPYAEQALGVGKLSTKDVDAFLDALVARKHALDKDFGDLYAKAVKARQAAVPGWKPVKPKTTGKAKWKGKDAPAAPTPPTEPATQTVPLFDNWIAEAKARYTAFSGKNLEQSNNWARFQRVINDLSQADLDHLHKGSYITDEQYQQAQALITQAAAQRTKAQAAYKAALADHDKAVQRWKKDLTDWRDANGIVDLTQGMDDGVIRHRTDHDGVNWAQRQFSETRYTVTERKWLKSYTGSAYSDWNDHLRRTEGRPTQYAEPYKHLDAAMRKQPIPEDVILHRGVGEPPPPFTLQGVKFGTGDDLSKLIGTVQVDHGYMSTSVGNTAAFSGKPIQLKMRAPAGTPGSYVQMFSNYSTERELILPRGTHMYVHNAYRKGQQWFLEVEIVPDGFDPAKATPKPSTDPWSE